MVYKSSLRIHGSRAQARTLSSGNSQTQCIPALLVHGLQSLPPSPKRAERKGRRRPFREGGSGHKQWNTVFSETSSRFLLRAKHSPPHTTSLWYFFFSPIRHLSSAAMSAAILMPRDAGRFVAETSKDVKVNQEGVAKVAAEMARCIKTGTYSIKSWKQHTLNPKTMDKAALEWIFFADTLNFSFWSADEDRKYAVRYKGETYTGYWSLCAAMNRALDEGIPLTDPKFYADISKEDLAKVFRSDSDHDIPLLDERWHVIREAGRALQEKYAGDVTKLIARADKNAQSLLQLVVADFPSYKDECDYGGKRLAIYKRAQILISDIWACFEGQGHGEFGDIGTVTMFADYRIPQALLYFGAMEYSDALMEYLRKDHLMNSGDRYEVEIRGCSIWATELVCQEVRRMFESDPSAAGLLVNSIMIDHYLWDYRRIHADADRMRDLPFHKIRCIYY